MVSPKKIWSRSLVESKKTISIWCLSSHQWTQWLMTFQRNCQIRPSAHGMRTFSRLMITCQRSQPTWETSLTMAKRLLVYKNSSQNILPAIAALSNRTFHLISNSSTLPISPNVKRIYNALSNRSDDGRFHNHVTLVTDTSFLLQHHYEPPLRFHCIVYSFIILLQCPQECVRNNA